MIVVVAVVALALGAALGALVMKLKQQAGLFRQQQAHEQDTAQAEQAHLAAQREQEAELIRLQQAVEHLTPSIESLRADVAQREQQIEGQREEIAALSQSQARLQQSLQEREAHHQEQLKQLTDARKQMTEQFQNLSAEVLKNNSQQLAQQQNERLTHLLKPFDQRLQAFGEQVRRTHDTDVRERISLKEELKRLAEQGERMTQEADGLAKALKGEAKTRGDWGEVILERVLEQSGLRRDQEYRVQVTHHDEDNRRFQPDVIIDLPDGKHLIIDSKLSLVSWLKVSEASDGEEQAQALDELIASTRTHVRGLSTKAYEKLEGINSVDFVLCFIPLESAFATVVNADPDLYRDAMERNVILVSPTTLLATMRTVALTWRSERQERNALKIAVEAGKMYDQLVAYSESLNAVGQRLDQAQVSYEQARKRLSDGRGNLLRRAENVRLLGAKASKRLKQDLLDEAEDALLESEQNDDADTSE